MPSMGTDSGVRFGSSGAFYLDVNSLLTANLVCGIYFDNGLLDNGHFDNGIDNSLLGQRDRPFIFLAGGPFIGISFHGWWNLSLFLFFFLSAVCPNVSLCDI